MVVRGHREKMRKEWLKLCFAAYDCLQVLRYDVGEEYEGHYVSVFHTLMGACCQLGLRGNACIVGGLLP